jgi:hypothetical protein
MSSRQTENPVYIKGIAKYAQVTEQQTTNGKRKQ